MNADADASASLEIEGDSLAAGLDEIARKFGAIANQINTNFGVANATLTQTGHAAASIQAGAPAASTLGQKLLAAAHIAQMVAAALASVVAVCVKLIPFVKFIPDAWGSWVPKIKHVIEENERMLGTVAAIRAGVMALQGRLGLMTAAFTAWNASQTGVFANLGARIANGIMQLTGLRVSARTAELSLVAMGTGGALAMSRIVSTSRGALAIVRNLAASTALSARSMTAAGGGLISGFGRAASTASMILAPVAGLALALGPIGAGALSIAGAFSGVKKSIDAAAQTQGLQMSFVTLLGSVDKARARMAELAKFAADTPFEIPNIAKASRTLETLTKGALSTGKGLEMVGDAASLTQQPIEELSVHFGRLYDGLMNGRAVGESLARLQELGIISSSTRARIEQLQAQGEKGAKVWGVAAADFARFSGEMRRQSGTWSGMMSNLSDTVGGLFRAFGTPIITALSPFLQQLIDKMGSLTGWAEKAGTIFAGWSALIAQIFTDGLLADALFQAGKVGFMAAVNFLLPQLAGIGNVLLTVLGGVGRMFVSMLAAATTADFWKGLGNALLSAGAAFGALLMNFIAKMLDALSDVPGLGDSARRGADNARQDADTLAKISADQGAKAGANLAPLFDRWQDDIARTMSRLGTAFAEGRDEAKGFQPFDVAAAQKELIERFQPSIQRAQAAVNAAAKAGAQGSLPPPIANPAATDTGKGKGADVASVQKIGGGGGFSITRADPLLSETRTQTGEIRKVGEKIDKLANAVARQNTTTPDPVFSGR